MSATATPAAAATPASGRLKAADVMALAEVAKLLHVPRSTVSDWARRGVLPSVKIGRRRLCIRRQIEAMLLRDGAR